MRTWLCSERIRVSIDRKAVPGIRCRGLGESLKDSNTRSEWEEAGPAGVGGWLVVLIAILWLVAIFRGGVGAATLAALRFANGAEGHAGLITGIVEVVAAVFASTTAFLLMRRNGAGPLLGKMFFFANALYYLGLLVLALKGSAPYLADAIPAWVMPAGFMAGSVACIIYLSSSERVANTYADGGRSSTGSVDELSVVPRTRVRPWDGWKDDDDTGEQLSMRGEPTTAEVEARLLSSVKARIAERTQPQDEKRPRPRYIEEPNREESPVAEAHPAPAEVQPAIMEALPAVRPVRTEVPAVPAELRPARTDEIKASVANAVARDSAPEPQPGTPAVPEANLTEDGRREELILLKARIMDGLIDWLHGEEHSFQGTRGVADEEKIHGKLLKQVGEICDHVWGVHVGRFATLPNTPDSDGSLTKELQKWAVAQAALRLTRSLDIRAAMEAKGPFEKMAQDREYLMTIAQKNAWEEGFAWSTAVVEYEGCTGPEIACSLIVKAQRDLAEARMWAQVARLAGDPDFLNRFEEAGSKAFQESLQYWRARAGDTGQNRSGPASSAAAEDGLPGRHMSTTR